MSATSETGCDQRLQVTFLGSFLLAKDPILIWVSMAVCVIYDLCPSYVYNVFVIYDHKHSENSQHTSSQQALLEISLCRAPLFT